MAGGTPAIVPIPRTSNFRELEKWRNDLLRFVTDISTGTANSIPWVTVNKAGSNLNEIETRNHNDLQNLDSGNFQHLTLIEHNGLVLGAETDLHTHDHTKLNNIGTFTHVQIDSEINRTRHGGELTISGGVVSITNDSHRIDTEADAATDDLDTINGAAFDGQRLIIRAENSARTVKVADGTGNLVLGSDFSMSNTDKRLMLEFDLTSGNWYQISRSDI